MNPSAPWIQQAREKLEKHAGTQTKDDQAVAEAFAQQAYTAVGNRDRKIMCDPYLLGFEIVDKNEENNRLVGVFAFRVSGEILMVPVFFLNGKIKGQDLLYRKPVNRFYPNTEKWISYFVGRGEDETGRGVDRRSNSEARIHLGIDRMSRMPGSYKRANAKADEKLAPREGYRETAAELQPGDSGYVRSADGYWDLADGEYENNKWMRPPASKDPMEASMAREDRKGKSKRAADATIDIKAEWKEACDKSGFRPEHIEQFMFADFLADTGMGKQAADLAKRVPWFADSIVLAGLLDKPLTKKASAPKRSLEYHVDPIPGSSEDEVSAHFLRGYSFVDKRAAESLSTAVDTSPFSRAWSSLRKTGINRVAGKDGTYQKVLWAPTTSGDDRCDPYGVGSVGRNGPRYTSYPEHRLVFLEGPDKGCVLAYRNGCPEEELPLFTDDMEPDEPAPGDKEAAEPKVPGESTPQAGKAYVVWLPALERLFGEPFFVDSIESTGDVTKINFEKGHNYGETRCRLILRKDLEETCAEDLKGGPNSGMPRVIGGDAVWIPIEAQLNHEHGMPETPANVISAEFQPPASFQPVTMRTIDEALANTKMASLVIERNPRSGLLALRDHKGKIRVEDYTPRRMAIKLARDLRLPGEEAIELVDLAQTQVKTAFNLLPPGYMDGLSRTFTGMSAQEATWMKEAHAQFYDRDIDPEEDFDDYDYDEDLDIPVENSGQFQDYAEARRERYSRPAQNFLDAHDPGQGRNPRYHDDPDHIPDEMILRMVHPMEEMSRLGQQLGLDTLMDHGAVASMVKVYDVKPYMREYISKLENSLDHLGRLVFMLYWKPKDFSELFGQDDIPQIENKLTGVFSSYGDLILELLQSSGEKG